MADAQPDHPLSQAEKNVFGTDARRGPDGRVVETGVGSVQPPPHERARIAANYALHAARAGVDAAKAALDVAVATAKAVEESIAFGHKAREEHERLKQERAQESAAAVSGPAPITDERPAAQMNYQAQVDSYGPAKNTVGKGTDESDED